MKIEEGKFYMTRDGRKAGPIRRNVGSSYAFEGSVGTDTASWREDGRFLFSREDDLDLIAEWTDEPDGPVQMRPTIMPGTYGIVTVCRVSTGAHRLELNRSDASADELRAAAAVLVQLADALEGGAK